jgi:hypothetical protein
MQVIRVEKPERKKKQANHITGQNQKTKDLTILELCLNMGAPTGSTESMATVQMDQWGAGQLKAN